MRILLFVFLATSYMQGQELNHQAQVLKEQEMEKYSKIKLFAQNKWGNDHTMVLHEINKQSESFSELALLYSKGNVDKEILSQSMSKWCESSDTSTCDYRMVLYDYKKQLKAKSKY